jgi:hypothetical protein
VDVEEYFQVVALEPVVPRSDWASFQSPVVPGTELILELLARYGARGTFFVLGWVAERHPALVRWVTHSTPGEFRESVRRSKQLLDELVARAITSGRGLAPYDAYDA